MINVNFGQDIKINETVRTDRRLSIRMIAKFVNIDKETVRKILHNDLNVRKVCVKLVPKLNCKEICPHIFEKLQHDREIVEKIIICDETWISQYDTKIKRQFMQWKTAVSLRIKNARMSKLKFKEMLFVFFDINGVVHTE